MKDIDWVHPAKGETSGHDWETRDRIGSPWMSAKYCQNWTVLYPELWRRPRRDGERKQPAGNYITHDSDSRLEDI